MYICLLYICTMYICLLICGSMIDDIIKISNHQEARSSYDNSKFAHKICKIAVSIEQVFSKY